MVRLVGSAGSLFWSYSARASGSVGRWAQAVRSKVSASAIPPASALAAQRRWGAGRPFERGACAPRRNVFGGIESSLVDPFTAPTPQKEDRVSDLERQSVALLPFGAASPRGRTIRIAA